MGNPSKGKTHQKIFLKDDDKPSTICSHKSLPMSQDDNKMCLQPTPTK